MPPKKPPYEYTDANRPPFLEDLELAGVLRHAIRRRWEFLPDDQLDTNFEEWKSAADAALFNKQEIKKATLRTNTLRLIHTCDGESFTDFGETGTLTSRRYRDDHPAMYPDHQHRSGNPTETEKSLGLDDFVNFSFNGLSLFNSNPGMNFIEVNARELLLKRSGIVFPFDSRKSLLNTPFHERPMILQALALRTADFATLLPTFIAAHNRDEPRSVQPLWFTEQFGELSFIDAEIMLPGCVYIGDVFHDATGANTVPA